ncbi:MAG: chromosome segregation protein SMC, partial [Candidatus Omnitrophica bacterium]|nr:chromosome segregation protein SMC [Candidatus Omnitrophota bacterium]
AARKLEATENNLLRIGDIIEEVRRQIGSIERQARKAERYKEEFQRLQGLDTKVSFIEFKKLMGDAEELKKHIAGHKDNEAALLKETADLNSGLLDLKTKLADVESKLSEAQFKEVTLDSEIKRSKDKVSLNAERCAELDTFKQSLINEQAAVKKNIMELEEVLAGLNKEVAAVSGIKAQRESLLGQKEARLNALEQDIKNNEHGIRDGKLKLIDVLSLTSRTKNDLTKLTEKEAVEKEISTIREQFNRVQGEVLGLEEKHTKEAQYKAELESGLARKNEELAQNTKIIEGLQAQRLSSESRLAMLQDMIQRYEGFAAGSKAILLEKKDRRLSIPGVHGAIAELIRVKRGYETAVEASLGELLQCVVVENKNAAVDLIKYLKANNLGKATIVSLDSVSPVKELSSGAAGQATAWKVPPQAEQAGIKGRLSDFIDTDDKFKNLVAGLFEGTYIADDLEALRNIRHETCQGVKFVTLAGEVFSSGFLTGGAAKEDADSGILNRKLQAQEIEALLARIKDESGLLNSKDEALSREIAGITGKIDSVDASLRQDEVNLANKRSQRENTEGILKKLNDELSVLNLELDEITEEIDVLRQRQGSYEIELKRLDADHAVLQNTVNSSQAFLESAFKEKEGLLVEITRTRTELANAAEQEKSFSSNLKMRQDFLANQKALLSEKEKNFADSTLRQEELKNEAAALESAAGDHAREKEKIAVEFIDVKAKKSELAGLINKIEGEFSEKETQLNALKDSSHESDMKLQENSFKVETLKTRMLQAYKIELDRMAPPEEQGAVSLEAATAEIAELRQKIDKMGPVNLVAIEEHQELKERFDFLSRQKDDLLNAKESLLEAIKKINKTTRELFMDTFLKVSVEFKEYYKYLFGGGQAEIVLLDENDVLECGIEIIARPPGKKPQSISLLSGGEKALTAAALIFAIFKVKPSPFCILDEVDAPLDESNIGRFTKILAEFAKVAQFIVITHNKRTISAADVMYGITMAQRGISKVVSVKFAKDKEAQKEPVPV